MSAPTSTDRLRAAGAHTLGDDSSPEAARAVLERWGKSLDGLDELTVETERQTLVAIPGFSAKMVDAAKRTYFKGDPKDVGQGTALEFPDPERWPDPIDGDTLLTDLVKSIRRFVILPEGGYTALALWTVHTHAMDATVITPIITLTSAEKQSGKTTCLWVLEQLVAHPLSTANLSAAVLFRVVDKHRPTLLIDEADRFLADDDELVGLVNSSHQRGGFSLRCVGDDFEVRKFGTFTASVFAAIGKLPNTIEDRSIVVQMVRKAPDETVERFRLDRRGELEPHRRQAWTWAQDHLDELRQAEPEMPTRLSDRGKDNWKPLLGIADMAGGVWPERARKAAVTLAALAAETENSIPIQLLADIWTMFCDVPARDGLPSAEIVSRLIAQEDRPWAELDGKAITAHKLAAMLKPFDIYPKKRRFGDDKSLNGYGRSDFEEPVRRYLSLFHSGLEQESGLFHSESPESPQEINVVPLVPLKTAPEAYGGGHATR